MRFDDIIIGGGHNALTASAYLGQARRRVLVLEKRDHVGGAAISATAFAGVDARLSRYAYLVSLMPRQIIDDLQLDLQLVRPEGLRREIDGLERVERDGQRADPHLGSRRRFEFNRNRLASGRSAYRGGG